MEITIISRIIDRTYFELKNVIFGWRSETHFSLVHVVTRYCKFLWWLFKDWFFSNTCMKLKSWSSYTILSASSCISLISLLKVLLWYSQTEGRKLNCNEMLEQIITVKMFIKNIITYFQQFLKTVRCFSTSENFDE